MRLLLTGLLLLAGPAPASSLDRTAIKRVLQTGSPGFKRCYAVALREQPELAGKARLTLTVSPHGAVSEVVVEFSRLAPEFTQCLRGVALKLRFFKGPGEIELIWPIVFQRD